jgi:hypothetical protein
MQEGFIDVAINDGRSVPLNIETSTLIKFSKLAENIKANLERGIPRFHQRPNFGACRYEPLAIVGAGPSLKQTIEKVKGFKNVLVCGSGHDFAVRNGIVPNYAVVCDGGVDDKKNLSLKQRETIYLIASQCDPGMFDHLEGYPVEMWHYRGQAVERLEDEPQLLNGEPSMGWGCAVTLVAIDLALGLGFQHLHFFGLDSSYGAEGEHHCAKIHGSLDYDKNIAKIGEKEFVTDKGLMVQAEQFFKLVMANNCFHSTIYGDGLIAAMAQACIDSDPAWANCMSVV